jgi:short subunit dehydrogenase-like uncharacterized protein
MVGSHVIYGATGYCGRLLVARALAHGLSPVLSARDPTTLSVLGAATGLPWRAAVVTEPGALDTAFAGAQVVLNAAGPFSQTAEAVADACLRAGAHYLDITGEVRVVERLAVRHAAARSRRAMLMPAIGFEVVPSDCLANHVAGRLPRGRSLAIAVTQPNFLSAGSVKTLLDGAGMGLVRRAGTIQPLPIGSVERRFDFGWGAVSCLNVSLADVTTAHYSTGIPNVMTFVEASPMVRAVLAFSRTFAAVLRTPAWQSWLAAWVSFLRAEAAPARTRDDVTMRVVAEAEDGVGHRVGARLRTPEPYTVTATAAVAILKRVLDGDVEPGFQTAARVYGADFALSIPGVEREDME